MEQITLCAHSVMNDAVTGVSNPPAHIVGYVIQRMIG